MLHIPIVADGEKSPGKELIDFLAGPAQNTRMICVGGNSPDPEEDQRFQGADILLRIPEPIHVVVVIPPAGGSAG